MKTLHSSPQRSPAPAPWSGLAGLAGLAGLILCLAGCDNQSAATGADNAVASQVAARVDGDEISIHQINDMLERTKTRADDEASAKRLRQQVLDKLVDQQLLVRQAIGDKLDRTPDVQMALDGARREVLASAYLKQIATTRIKPDDAAIRQYYEEHPPLFAKRRVFVLQEINFVDARVPAETRSAIKAVVEAGKPIDETVRALRARGVEFTQSEGQRPSELITTDLLPALFARQPGQGLFVQTTAGTSLLYVKSFEEAPLSEAVAWPRIARFLENQIVNQELVSAMAGLRSRARIDYFGDFAAPAEPLQK
ncbi:peptidyl-prolyl cis-trans isomerase, EpsD family [Xylophilus sp. Kf1]|nr:peptidyl-prolyl cis-trans isomerase, EpsD family [Xylophilus sp. Kf1]